MTPVDHLSEWAETLSLTVALVIATGLVVLALWGEQR